jgi:hypothetical protein
MIENGRISDLIGVYMELDEEKKEKMEQMALKLLDVQIAMDVGRDIATEKVDNVGTEN